MVFWWEQLFNFSAYGSLDVGCQVWSYVLLHIMLVALDKLPTLPAKDRTGCEDLSTLIPHTSGTVCSFCRRRIEQVVKTFRH
ncbi:hypothetical protein AMTR_s00025p00127990 [Amborella trichopoda]|uniref:Uncharacterized protein n=1 Tax=Amborella trichopoda TaxID=13333 RepID=W1PQU2_AMBTC|nr:hypothetical protein AMTR_s00025p00127990 [Amborella trichopoda]